ncbi:ATP-binding protein [Streptomyces sp. NPDC012888]|uniref:ATP-binding protein n=1 Tax=Streptomyces sp. NPDC012888 TaxID=3364855 RepID=UPI00368E9088
MRGRVAERERVERMLEEARRGSGGALLLRGEAGIGKTTLLDHAVRRAGDARVLRAEGVESEMELAYGGLHQLFLPVLDLVGTLPGPQAAALRAVFGLTDEPVRDRFTVGLAVLTLLSDASRDRPVLCVVDDAQWLDQPSVDALAFAARRLRDERVAVLFGVRDGAAGAVVTGVPELVVEGLDRASAAALLPGLAPYAAERVLDEARGNPLALATLADALTPAQRAGQLGPLPLGAAADGPAGRVRDAFAERIGRLPAATRTLLLVAAADDTGELPRLLAAAAGLGAGLADLEPAEAAGLVRPCAEGSTLRFRHPLVRYAAYHGAPLASRIAAHRALAAALDPVRQGHRRAWHLAAAATGPDEEAAAELERVAEWAGNRQAMASASAAYERAARLSADPLRRARRLIAAARRAADAGQDERSGALADQVPLPVTDPGPAAEFARVRAVVELGCRRPVAAARILLDCADRVGRGDPGVLPGLLTDAVHAAFSAGDAALVAEVAARAPQLPVAAVPARLFGGDVPGGLGALRDLLDAVRAPGTDLMDRLVTGLYCQLVGDHAAAREVAAAAVEHCRVQGVSGWLPTTLHLLARTELALGRHADARAHAEEALRLAGDFGLDHRAAHLRAALAWPAAISGGEDECREQVGAALEYAVPRGVGRAEADALWARGLLELGLGRAESALEPLESAYGRAGHPLPGLPVVPDLVEAAVRAGRAGRAAEPVRVLGEWADALGTSALRAAAHRCRAMTSRDAEAEGEFLAALRLYGAADFDRARTALLYGEWLRRTRRKVDAREQLRSALELFDRLDARPWARRAEAELRAAGDTGDLAARDEGPVSLLSPQEREVVRLAAGGATNREIAARLFLSPRTVGHHLYRAFPKLGVGSRAELAPLFGHASGAV